MRRLIVVLALLLSASPVAAIQVVNGSYTGTGSDNTDITISPACQPVAVFVQRDTAAVEAWARFASMGTNVSVDITGTALETTVNIKSLLSNGFRLGTGSSTNGSGSTHYYTAICDNGQNDVATSTWNGDTTDNRDISLSPSFTPEVVMVLQSSSGVRWFRGATSHSGDAASRLNSAAGDDTNAIQSFSAGSFQVGTSANATAVTYYSLALKGSSGVASGNFSGNGSDNRDIATIASPKLVWVKGNSGTNQSAWRFGGLAGDAAWCASGASAADMIQTLTSTGFQVGTNTCVNENAVTMRWMALTDVGSSISMQRRRFQ